MIKRLFAILLALAMLCTVLAAAAEDAAEGTQQETAVETATEETQEAASEEAAEEVTEEATEAAPPILLLTAYGEEITDQSNDLVSFINDYLSYLSQYGYDVSSPEIQSYIMASSLEYLLEQKVAMHKAADLGLDEISAEERATIEADTASTWEEEIAYYMENYYGITEDSSEEESTQARTEILSALEEQGYTLETVTAQALEQEVISRVEGSVIDQVSATDEDILQYYNDLVSEGKDAAEEDLQSYISSFDMAMTYPGYFEPVYYIPEGYRSVIHILLTPDTELLENWKGLSAKLEEAGEETEATGSGGEVFPNITVRTITDDEINELQYIYAGVDFGFSVDPAVFMRVAYDSKHDTIYLLDEIYKKHCSNKQLADEIKARGYDYTGQYKTANSWGIYPEVYKEKQLIICDSAEPKSINDLQGEGLKAIACQKFPGCVLYRIKWLQNRRIVIDPARTPNAHREFISYEYMTTKDGEFLADVPDKDNHGLDAVAYSLDRLIYRKGVTA